MNHPPIPPKSIFFKPDGEFGTPGYTTSPETEDRKKHRAVMAACAEVEWRKRGERWDALNSKIIDSYAPKNGSTRLSKKDSKRMDIFMAQARAAYQAAEDWRAWGASK